MRSRPRTEPDWRAYLQQYSDDVADDDDLPGVSDVQRTQRWLGTTGASEADLRALEERAGAPLPPSYRAFLAVSARAGGEAWPELAVALRAWRPAPARLLPVAVLVDPLLGPLVAARPAEALAAALD